MLASVGLQQYGHISQEYYQTLNVHDSEYKGIISNKEAEAPVKGQKVIPGSEREAYLIDRFGEKKLKQLDILQCETCANRKYQDGSDDPGVSFKTPQHIDPDMSAAAVSSHENEHVIRESASAEMEDREVVSQSVTLHSAICPECGKVYISGGETRTVTRAQGASEEAFVGNLVDVSV